MTESRRIVIACYGRMFNDGASTHQLLEVDALVSYWYDELEWWDADERADRSIEIEKTPRNRQRPDLALAVAGAADRFVIRCTVPECPQTFTSADNMLGRGYRPVERAHELVGRHANRAPHEKLSRLADRGESWLPLVRLRDKLREP